MAEVVVVSGTRSRVEVLFISEHALWPLDQGSCVHGFHMAAALQQLGVRVGLASQAPLPASAPAKMQGMSIPWPEATQEHLDRFLAGWQGMGMAMRRRLARYQGRNLRRFAGVVPLVELHRPAVVIGLGQHAPLMLHALRCVRGVRRIWYAADEPVYFHLSCMRREPLAQWPVRLSKVALYAGLEALFVRDLDGVIGVSPMDRFLLRAIGGARRAVTIRNGVDMDYFTPAGPASHTAAPRSLVFWGRMDFEPNADAVTWFARNVWPRLRWHRPDATWQIVGKNPTPRVQRLSGLPGVRVLGEVADVRPYARAAAVTILPMRCGGGIKNKLLEAAAMARPIVASPRAVRGLVFQPGCAPVVQCSAAGEWVQAIRRLWCQPQLAASLGRDALRWVQRHHSWEHAARLLMQWFESVPGSVAMGTTHDTPAVATNPVPQREPAVQAAA